MSSGQTFLSLWPRQQDLQLTVSIGLSQLHSQEQRSHCLQRILPLQRYTEKDNRVFLQYAYSIPKWNFLTVVLTTEMLSGKLNRNSDREFTLTPREFHYDNHHYQYLKYTKREKASASKTKSFCGFACTKARVTKAKSKKRKKRRNSYIDLKRDGWELLIIRA